MKFTDVGLLINCRNHQTAEVTAARITPDPEAARQERRRRDALARLKDRAETDRTLADLLTVLGLG